MLCLPDRQHGFTLIELLVVVAIISLLIAVMVPGLSAARDTAKSVQCLANTRSIALAMTMYSDSDSKEFFPTARMPGMSMGGNPPASFTISWIYLLGPYVGFQETLPDNPDNDAVMKYVAEFRVAHCPADKSTTWDSERMPRLASYAMNAYFTPNHPPHWGVTSSEIRRPSESVLVVDMTEDLAIDHFMPMYWGDPPHVSHAMRQGKEWDIETLKPKKICHTRHPLDRANYVFADGHAAPHRFEDTWEQFPGESPTLDWYDVKR